VNHNPSLVHLKHIREQWFAPGGNAFESGVRVACGYTGRVTHWTT
jgi:hypothetical protein